MPLTRDRRNTRVALRQLTNFALRPEENHLTI